MTLGQMMEPKAMSIDTKELLDAHEAMVAVLDAKWPNHPEWRAFRAIDRALLAALTKAVPQGRPHRERAPLNFDASSPTPYMKLAAKALDEIGEPLTTARLMEYIGARRSIGDPTKARNVVQSSLSKHDRFKSIPWEGGRAWWYADKPVPKKETAGG
jgi:hypothetical protein